MATLQSDTLYATLYGNRPRRVPVLRETRITERWQELAPLATIESRKHPEDPTQVFHFYKTRHRSRLLALLAANIPWRTILHHRLDDPIPPDGVFEFQLRAAVERRRVRLGRVKGQKRTRV